MSDEIKVDVTMDWELHKRMEAIAVKQARLEALLECAQIMIVEVLPGDPEIIIYQNGAVGHEAITSLIDATEKETP